MMYWKLSVSLTLLGFSALLRAEIYQPQCPEVIKTSEQIKEIPKGWETIRGTEHNYLSSISFYSDHPDKMASLKPDFANQKKAKWEFSPQELIYLVCHYNQSGIELTQPLPIKTIKCTVTYNQNLMGDRGFLPKNIECTKQS
ncbi:STY0301 family protein [Legionella quateirensis]|uniref:DUF3757 domain-containing protein n=1 Tax=Legionella quateirensis TaxID=45072 RepID=A0A378KS70_9GAMM|nr:STY0301 family protein [Legionella quateirensis]KTD51340.1 hypothetical protein Lqua_1567 [Legionella quateirensis]STY17412.1 Uncharacterised protein [Legionella quateirensis]